MSVLIVFDPNNEGFLNDRIFDEEYAEKFPGALAFSKLRKALNSNGIEIVTSDRYISGDYYGKTVFLISEMITGRFEAIVKKGAIPFILLTGESPNVAWKFYFRLKSHSKKFRHVMLFSGFKSFVDNHVDFLNFYWPNSHASILLSELSWDKRKLLVMIAANKQRKGEAKSLKGLSKLIVWSVIGYFNSLFDFKDLYQKRLEAIAFFSARNNFDLFGMGWANTQSLNEKYKTVIKKLNPSPVDSKIDQLAKYRFALCFENCVFPGYVTEKIFDCFFAGCIPIYFGAPDIEKFIPADTFIDFRKFKGFAELQRFIEDMTQLEFDKRIMSINLFLGSKEFDLFTDQHFVANIVKLTQAENSKH